MPKGESNYCHVEVDFGADGRLKGWTDAQKWGYLSWWKWALTCRRELLLPHQTDIATIARHTGADLRSIQNALSKGACTPGGPLLVVYETGHIRVCGIRKKHSILRNWHDDDDERLKGELAPISPQSPGEMRASERAGTSRNGTSRASTPKKPPPIHEQKAVHDVSFDPLEEPKPEPHNPYRFWQQFKPVLSVSDSAFIAAMWEEFQDVQICEAMKIAIDKGKSLGYVRGILAKNKQAGTTPRTDNGTQQAVAISEILSKWTPEELAAAARLKPQPVKGE